MTINISVPEAASQFAELLELVKHGEEVSITEAGVIPSLGVNVLLPFNYTRK
jgi:hypothetical protein